MDNEGDVGWNDVWALKMEEREMNNPGNGLGEHKRFHTKVTQMPVLLFLAGARGKEFLPLIKIWCLVKESY